MLAGVVDVAVEGITTPMRDMVRIIVVKVVVKGMGGQLMNGGGDCWTLDLSFFLSIVQMHVIFLRSAFTISNNNDLLSLSSNRFNHTLSNCIYIRCDFDDIKSSKSAAHRPTRIKLTC